MSSIVYAPGAEPLLYARLTPSRSLSRHGQMIALGGFAAASLVVALVFISRGYWPIAPFVGLDAALLAFAFWVIRRRGQAYEEVIVEADSIVIRRADGLSHVDEDRLPTAWTRLERQDHPDFGCQALRLRRRGQSASVADMLSPPDREAFAKSLDEALSRARRGGLAARQPVISPSLQFTAHRSAS